MESVSTNALLIGRTILIAPSVTRELATELERFGARVLGWPQVEISTPQNYAALDEAIENLFGYDWIIFRNTHAVEYFLRRFHQLGHETSELDSLRICTVGAATTSKLEASQIHVDFVPVQCKPEAVLNALANYVGGRDSLRALNFLIPRAAIARDSLAQALEDADARVDEVTAYRRCSMNDPELARINALLAGGGVDCIAFVTNSDVREFAELFDTNDLAGLLSGVAVACIDESTKRTAAKFGLRADIALSEFTISALAQTIASYFSPLNPE